jgi:hypothetical protein
LDFIWELREGFLSENLKDLTRVLALSLNERKKEGKEKEKEKMSLSKNMTAGCRFN